MSSRLVPSSRCSRGTSLEGTAATTAHPPPSPTAASTSATPRRRDRGKRTSTASARNDEAAQGRKSEIRISKFETNPKFEAENVRNNWSSFCTFLLLLRACFGFRVSDL